MKKRAQHAPYNCPRCDYQTSHKATMRRHLYHSVRPCPGTKSYIELTEEVKGCVMDNRIYREPVAPVTPSITNIINNNQTIMNYIANLDTKTKLTNYMAYNNTELTDFEQKVEDVTSKYATAFQDRRLLDKEPRRLEQSKLLDTVHLITKSSMPDKSDMVIFFDFDLDRVYYYVCNKWEEHNINEGLEYLIDCMVSNCFDYYELYLIRKLQNCRAANQAELEDSLEEYYKFTATFNIKPAVRGKCDAAVLHNPDESDYEDDPFGDPVETHRIADKYNDMYERVKLALTSAQKRELVKSVVDIIKKSSKTNAKELNKSIANLIVRDENFKTLMI